MTNPSLLHATKTSVVAKYFARMGIMFAALMLLFGCATPPRMTMTEPQLHERATVETYQTRERFQTAIGKLLTRGEHKMESASTSTPPVLDILALSGGGDHGAFGAGFLVGWGSAMDPQWRRPDFDAVSGVSTGALLAPFAYIGTDDAYRCVEAFYRNPKADWIQKRGPLFFLPSNSSFATIPGLERDIRWTINRQFVGEMARQSQAAKVLMISATDLDLGRQKFWDVGIEAELATANGNPDPVQRIMLASSAVPAAFPPVEIEQSLYADGGVTANIFLRLDPRSPEGFISRWRQKHPNWPLPKVRYWIIINNQLTHRPKTVQKKWTEIAGSSLDTSVRSATITEVRWLTAEADYANAAFGTDIEIHVVAIPDVWKPPVEGEFKRETMQSLADLGRQMGAAPNSWRVWTTPRKRQSHMLGQSSFESKDTVGNEP